MSAAGTRESWDAGGLAFSQPSVGTSDAEAEEVWDDRAILKAFDDALNTHTRKPVNGVEARKWDKHAAQGVATPPVMDNRGPPPPGSRDGQGSQQGDRRFASLLTAKGGAEAAAARQAAGVPGPWEPVAGSREGEGQETAMPKGEAGQRFEYAARNGPYDNQRGEEFGAHHYPPGAPHPPPHGGGPLEEGWDRQGLPPPPPPPMPHGGAGPHAAAFQSLDGVYDDDLADLLLAWYYSGYYTGRYRALQDARNPRYRRNYPAMPGHGPPAHGPPAHGPPAKHGSPAQHAPPAQHGPLTPSSAANHGEAWERQGWQGHPAAPGFGPSPAGRAGHADARGGGGGSGPAGRRPGSASGP